MRTLTLSAFVISLAACSVSAPETSANAATGEPAVEVVAEAAAEEAVEAPASQPASQPTEEEAGPAGAVGAPLTLEGDPLSVSEAIAQCSGTGEPCKVRGTIDRVCQNRGCWFTLVEDSVEATIRIRMQDYAFFVPMDSMGHEVTFEGTLELQEVPQDLAQHYADDEAVATGQEARVVDGPELTYQFMITGAEIH